MATQRFTHLYKSPFTSAPQGGSTYGTMSRRATPGVNSAAPYGYQRPSSTYSRSGSQRPLGGFRAGQQPVQSPPSGMVYNQAGQQPGGHKPPVRPGAGVGVPGGIGAQTIFNQPWDSVPNNTPNILDPSMAVGYQPPGNGLFAPWPGGKPPWGDGPPRPFPFPRPPTNQPPIGGTVGSGVSGVQQGSGNPLTHYAASGINQPGMAPVIQPNQPAPGNLLDLFMNLYQQQSPQLPALYQQVFGQPLTYNQQHTR